MRRKSKSGVTKYKVWGYRGEITTPYIIVEVDNKEKNMEGKALQSGRSALYMASRFNWQVDCAKV